MAKINGGIIGPNNPTGPFSAGGVWRLEDAFNAQKAGEWPVVLGYQIPNSTRFNSGSSDNLSRTPASASNRKTWTWSGWVKRSGLGSSATFDIFCGDNGATSFTAIRFANDNIYVQNFVSGTKNNIWITNAVFRDVSAWYHIVAKFDTTQASSTNAVLIYINGVSQSITFDTAGLGGYVQNEDGIINSTFIHKIGEKASTNYFAGYMAEINFIDGQALTPSSFGETDSDTGIWKPKAFSGTYGTNGFYLQFKNSASLGTDSSGNGNTFTVNNLTSVDQSTDTPTNNFATLNSLNVPASNQPTFSEGNLKSTSSTAVSGSFGGSSSIGVSKGKWYVEAKAGALASSNVMNIGVTYNPSETARTNNDNKENYEYTYNGSNGYKSNNSTDTAYGSSYTTGDIIGIALDLDNNKIWWSKNGTFQNSGDPVAGTGQAFTLTSGETYFFYQQDETGASSNTSTFEFNFGSPIYSANSYTDGAGYGNFSYAVPSGYYSLCTKNLATFG
jgi:hypothetical protein